MYNTGFGTKLYNPKVTSDRVKKLAQSISSLCMHNRYTKFEVNLFIDIEVMVRT